MLNVAIIGFGARGQCYARNLKGKANIVAVCDKWDRRLNDAETKFGIPKEALYLSDKEFFAKGKLAELLIVSTQDADHYGHAMQALELGYNLLLEKPMSDNYERCYDIYKKAQEKELKVFVCHVLRYAPFFVYIKNMIESGKLGKIQLINQTENVAYWHQGHSFVRGNWGVTETSTPMIIAKCCHDLDMLYWLIDEKCTAVSSMGSLDFFTKDNAPEGCADHCVDCKYQDTCAHSCYKMYMARKGWTFHFPQEIDENDENAIKAALADKNNPYSRCVFKCDNTAVDHQVVNMLFEGGATAHLTMTAFSAECYREIHVHGTKGEIYGNMMDNKLTVHIYGQKAETVDVNNLSDGMYGHGGGDARLVSDIVDYFDGKDSRNSTLIENSLMSHKIGFAAEKSRLNGGEVVRFDD